MSEQNPTPPTTPLSSADQPSAVSDAGLAPASLSPPAAEPPVEAVKSKPNFDQKHSYGEDIDELRPNQPMVAYPAGTRTGISAAEAAATNSTKRIDTQQLTHLRLLGESKSVLPVFTVLEDTAARPDAMFLQEVQGPEGPLRGGAPRYKAPTKGQQLTNEQALMMFRNKRKLGTMWTVPLWHSGFWMTFHAPGEGELLELYRQISQDKTTIGRSTYGLLFSQTSVHVVQALTNFAMDHLHSCSLEVGPTDNLFKYIKTSDYQALLWGLVCATWPNGYQIQRACITDLTKCNHVLTSLINPARLLWTDTHSLTEKQRIHMAKRQKNSVDLKDVQLYQDEFVRGQNKRVTIDEGAGIDMVLRMPSLYEYIDAGIGWITTLEEQYGRAIGLPESERNAHLIKHTQAQAMRQYSHFVHSIIMSGDDGDDEQVITEPEVLLGMLNDYSSVDTDRERFNALVQQFQGDSMISFPAIPNYKCPRCGGWQHPQATEGSNHELIPLDIAQTFFHLLMQKLLSVEKR